MCVCIEIHVSLAHNGQSTLVYGIHKYVYSLKGQQVHSGAYLPNLTHGAEFSTDFHTC